VLVLAPAGERVAAAGSADQHAEPLDQEPDTLRP